MQKAAAAPEPKQLRAAAEGLKGADKIDDWWNNAVHLDNVTAAYGTTSCVYVTNQVPMTQTYTSANLGL